MKWTVAAAVAPRLCLIGFKFAQPFLINDLINYVSDNGSSELSGVKYGFMRSRPTRYRSGFLTKELSRIQVISSIGKISMGDATKFHFQWMLIASRFSQDMSLLDM